MAEKKPIKAYNVPPAPNYPSGSWNTSSKFDYDNLINSLKMDESGSYGVMIGSETPEDLNRRNAMIEAMNQQSNQDYLDEKSQVESLNQQRDNFNWGTNAYGNPMQIGDKPINGLSRSPSGVIMEKPLPIGYSEPRDLIPYENPTFKETQISASKRSKAPSGATAPKITKNPVLAKRDANGKIYPDETTNANLFQPFLGVPFSAIGDAGKGWGNYYPAQENRMITFSNTKQVPLGDIPNRFLGELIKFARDESIAYGKLPRESDTRDAQGKILKGKVKDGPEKKAWYDKQLKSIDRKLQDWNLPATVKDKYIAALDTFIKPGYSFIEDDGSKVKLKDGILKDTGTHRDASGVHPAYIYNKIDVLTGKIVGTFPSKESTIENASIDAKIDPTKHYLSAKMDDKIQELGKSLSPILQLINKQVRGQATMDTFSPNHTTNYINQKSSEALLQDILTSLAMENKY